MKKIIIAGFLLFAFLFSCSIQDDLDKDTNTPPVQNPNPSATNTNSLNPSLNIQLLSPSNHHVIYDDQFTFAGNYSVQDSAVASIILIIGNESGTNQINAVIDGTNFTVPVLLTEGGYYTYYLAGIDTNGTTNLSPCQEILCRNKRVFFFVLDNSNSTDENPEQTSWKNKALDIFPWVKDRTQFNIRFRYQTDTSANYYGMAVDDIIISNRSGTVYWSDNCEGSYPISADSFPLSGQWAKSGLQCEWELGYPMGGPGTPHSGVGCIATDLDDTYNSGANAYLISPYINITNDTGEHLILDFWYWLQTEILSEGCNDIFSLDISTNQGTNWETVWGTSKFEQEKYIIRYLINTMPDTYYSVLCGSDLYTPCMFSELQSIESNRLSFISNLNSISASSTSIVWDLLYYAINISATNSPSYAFYIFQFCDEDDNYSAINSWGNEDSSEFPDGDEQGIQGQDDGNENDDFGGWSGADGIDGGVCKSPIPIISISLWTDNSTALKLQEVAKTSADYPELYLGEKHFNLSNCTLINIIDSFNNEFAW